MEKKSKKLLGVVALVVGVVAIGAVTLTSVNSALAQEDDRETPPIVQNISEAFGLDETEVEEVFQRTHEERDQARLESLGVPEDKVDDVQAKQEELRSKVEALRDEEMTVEERHNAMQSIKEEAEAWADDNGVDPRALRGRGVMGKGGMKGGKGMGMGNGMNGSGECMAE